VNLRMTHGPWICAKPGGGAIRNFECSAWDVKEPRCLRASINTTTHSRLHTPSPPSCSLAAAPLQFPLPDLAPPRASQPIWRCVRAAPSATTTVPVRPPKHMLTLCTFRTRHVERYSSPKLLARLRPVRRQNDPLTDHTAQVMKDESGRPFIVVREYVMQSQRR
jgi:hypothetical protein